MIESHDELGKVVDDSVGDKPITPLQDTNGGQRPPVVTPSVAAGDDGDGDDPFALDKFRLRQDFCSLVNVKKVLTVVPYRKPNRQEFIQVCPGNEHRIETAIFEDKIGHEMFLVDHRLREQLATEVFPVCLFTAITKQGDVFLWPVRLPGADGRTNSWNDSALAAARIAETHWIRVAANMNAGCYDIHRASGDLGEPDWPKATFQELLRLCFRDRLILDVDHPVLRSLRGEV